MDSPDAWRTVESADCAISVQTLPGGDFLVKLQAGPVSIRTCVKPAELPFLFPSERSTA